VICGKFKKEKSFRSRFHNGRGAKQNELELRQAAAAASNTFCLPVVYRSIHSI
jgi:hypothetical protein